MLDPKLCCALEVEFLEKAYELFDTIHSGQSSAIVRAKRRSDGQDVAIKLYADQLAASTERGYINMLQPHVNVCSILQATPCLHADTAVPGQRHCILQYYAHDLYGMIRRFPGGLAAPDVKHIGAQVLTALEFMHDHQVAHLALKPKSVLLEGPAAPPQASLVKLIHFKQAVTMGHQAHAVVDRRPLSMMWYDAPEVLAGDACGVAADMWSFGCLLAEMITGRPLFKESKPRLMLELIIGCVGRPTKRLMTVMRRDPGLREIVTALEHGTLDPGESLISTRLGCVDCDNELKQVLAACLRMDPELRPTASQLLHHVFRGVTSTLWYKDHQQRRQEQWQRQQQQQGAQEAAELLLHTPQKPAAAAGHGRSRGPSFTAQHEGAGGSQGEVEPAAVQASPQLSKTGSGRTSDSGRARPRTVRKAILALPGILPGPGGHRMFRSASSVHVTSQTPSPPQLQAQSSDGCTHAGRLQSGGAGTMAGGESTLKLRQRSVSETGLSRELPRHDIAPDPPTSASPSPSPSPSPSTSPAPAHALSHVPAWGSPAGHQRQRPICDPHARVMEEMRMSSATSQSRSLTSSPARCQSPAAFPAARFSPQPRSDTDPQQGTHTQAHAHAQASSVSTARPWRLSDSLVFALTTGTSAAAAPRQRQAEAGGSTPSPEGPLAHQLPLQDPAAAAGMCFSSPSRPAHTPHGSMVAMVNACLAKAASAFSPQQQQQQQQQQQPHLSAALSDQPDRPHRCAKQLFLHSDDVGTAAGDSVAAVRIQSHRSTGSIGRTPPLPSVPLSCSPLEQDLHPSSFSFPILKPVDATAQLPSATDLQQQQQQQQQQPPSSSTMSEQQQLQRHASSPFLRGAESAAAHLHAGTKSPQEQAQSQQDVKDGLMPGPGPDPDIDSGMELSSDDDLTWAAAEQTPGRGLQQHGARAREGTWEEALGRRPERFSEPGNVRRLPRPHPPSRLDGSRSCSGQAEPEAFSPGAAAAPASSSSESGVRQEGGATGGVEAEVARLRAKVRALQLGSLKQRQRERCQQRLSPDNASALTATSSPSASPSGSPSLSPSSHAATPTGKPPLPQLRSGSAGPMGATLRPLATLQQQQRTPQPPADATARLPALLPSSLRTGEVEPAAAGHSLLVFRGPLGDEGDVAGSSSSSSHRVLRHQVSSPLTSTPSSPSKPPRPVTLLSCSSFPQRRTGGIGPEAFLADTAGHG